MSEIIPFRGLLYNPSKVGDMSAVMAPPYDVISPKMQDDLYDRHPNNIVRLILGRTSPADTPGSDRYSRAAEHLQQWLSQSVLARDDRPAIYCYTQTYAQGGVKQTRKGFIALSKIEEFGKGKIHAHEQTLSGPKADRLKLMEACAANFSCIFSLYSEPKLDINKTLDEATSGVSPVIDVKDAEGIENRLWRIDDPQVIARVTGLMEGKPLFIADGHHRYETALNYRNMMREKNPDFTGLEPYNYVMMYFSNMDDEGMTIWPTHRVIHSVRDFNAGGFLGECGKYFEIEEKETTQFTDPKMRKAFLNRLEEAGRKITALGLHVRGRSIYYILTLKSRNTMDEVFGDAIPEVFKNLDVTVLHSLILSRILGITKEAQEKQQNLIYVKSATEAIDAVKRDSNQLAFLLNPTKIEQVKAVAEAGYVMPQKSTYFYPKLLSGLVMNLHTDKAAAAAKL